MYDIFPVSSETTITEASVFSETPTAALCSVIATGNQTSLISKAARVAQPISIGDGFIMQSPHKKDTFNDRG